MSGPKFANCSLEMLKRLVLPLLACIICFDCICGITVPCGQPYPAENGNLCYPCSAGHYKVSDCLVHGDQARCRPCENGGYQPDCDNATKCAHCKPFCNDPMQVKVKNCTTTTDMVCQCRAGYYWKLEESKSDEGHCKGHSKCKTGEGLIAVGTPYEDTKCAPCEEGVTFSMNDSFESCLPCSVCNSTAAVPCTAERDSVCNSLTEKPQPTKTPKDGGNSMVIVVVVVVVVILIALAVVGGIYLYRRRRRNNEKNITNGGSGLYRVDTHNGITHRSTQIQDAEVPSSQIENVFHYYPHQSIFHLGNTATSPLNNYETEIQKAQGPQSNGNDIQNKNKDQDNKSHETGDIGDDTEYVDFSSQNRCTLRVTHEDNFRNSGKNRSTEELQENHKTHKNSTNEDQKTVDDINQKSEKYILKQCTNKREDELQNGPTANDTITRSQETERHSSVLGDRTVIYDSNENVLESNVNVIYEGRNNAVNEISNLNGNVHGENNVDTSMDAAGVSARHGVQMVSVSAVNTGDNRIEINEEVYHTAGTNVSSEAEQAKGESQPDGNYGLTAIGTSAVRSTTCDLIEKDWQKVMVFLPRNLSWSDFKMFNRTLTAETNQELHLTVEADMDNAFLESHNRCQEAMFKLMIRCRQATPDATIKDEVHALERCQLNLFAERLISEIDNVHAPGKRAVIQNSDDGQNVVETFPRGELSSSEILQTVSNGVLANGQCSNNLQMMESKV